MWLCNKHCANLKACYFVRQWILNLQIQKACLGFHKIADLLCYYLLLYYPQGEGGHGHPRTPWPRPCANGLEPFIGLKVSHNEQKHAWSVVTSSISWSNFWGRQRCHFYCLILLTDRGSPEQLETNVGVRCFLCYHAPWLQFACTSWSSKQTLSLN